MSIASVLEALREEYRPTLREEANRLRAAIEVEDWPAARRISHRLAGTGGSYGFKEASAAARAIEEAIDEAPPNARAIAEALALLEAST